MPFFPKIYAQASLQLAEDAVVLVKAQVSRVRRPAVAARPTWSPCRTCPPPASGSGAGVDARRRAAPPPVVDRLQEILRAHPGTTAVHLRLLGGAGDHLRLDDGLRVTPTSALMGDLKALLGADCLA